MRVVRIEPPTEGAGLAEIDLGIFRLFCLATVGFGAVVGDVTFEVELFGSNCGKIWGGADTRRDAERDGMEVENLLFTIDGNGTGVALGDRDKGRFRLFGPGRMVVPALAPLRSLALDKPRGLVADLPVIEERVVDRERRVDVSDGVLVVFGGIMYQSCLRGRCRFVKLAQDGEKQNDKDA